MNASEAIKYMKSGELVVFDQPVAYTYFRMYSGDVIIELIPDAPVASTVKTFQTPEQFLSQYNHSTHKFKIITYE